MGRIDDDMISVYSRLGELRESFTSPLLLGFDSLAVGDVTWLSAEEIVVGSTVGSEIGVLDTAGDLLEMLSLPELGDIDTFDRLAVGDVVYRYLDDKA